VRFPKCWWRARAKCFECGIYAVQKVGARHRSARVWGMKRSCSGCGSGAFSLNSRARLVIFDVHDTDSEKEVQEMVGSQGSGFAGGPPAQGRTGERLFPGVGEAR
jgi:hypothetical protein